VTYIAPSGGANAFQAAIAAGTRNAIVAILSTADGSSSAAPAPPSESVTLSIAANGAAAALHRSFAQSLGSGEHVWAATLLQTGGARSIVQSAQQVLPLAESRPDERYRASLAALAARSRRSLVPLGGRRSALALARTPGAQASFWVLRAAIGTGGGSYGAVPATLRGVSAHGNVWIDDTLAFDTAAVQQIGVDFETAYDSDSRHFGTSEYSSTSPGARLTTPPCDAAGKELPGAGAVPLLIPPAGGVHVVLIVSQNTLGAGVGGYHSVVNLVPQAVANCFDGQPQSNEASMIVLGFAPGADLNFTLKEDFVRGTAHEFQHELNFVQHFVLAQAPQQEQTWINEGLSMLAQDFVVSQLFGGTPNIDVADAVRRAQLFLSLPEAVSLTRFSGISAGGSAFAYNCSACYGDAYLFERYLYDRFGGDAFAHAVEGGGAIGASNLRAATGTALASLISDYGVALAVSGLNATSDPRFSFTAFDPYGTYTDQFGRTVTLLGPSATLAAPGSHLDYTAFAGAFRYFATQPNPSQGAAVTVTDAAGALQLMPALIQH
jgi:hypothetical protein